MVTLEPTVGDEVQSTRPCAVISPDGINTAMSAFLVAPMTTGGHPYSFRVPCRFQGRDGYVVLDRLRAVATQRLIRRLDALEPATLSMALAALREMFAD